MPFEIEPPVQRASQSITEHRPQVGLDRLDCELGSGFPRPEERGGWAGEREAQAGIGGQLGPERIRQREAQLNIAEGKGVEARLHQRHHPLRLRSGQRPANPQVPGACRAEVGHEVSQRKARQVHGKRERIPPDLTGKAH